MKWLKDLFFGPQNEYLELGRVLAGIGGVLMVVGFGWNIVQGMPIELGPAGLGGGLGALFTGAAAIIWAKDQVGKNKVPPTK